MRWVSFAAILSVSLLASTLAVADSRPFPSPAVKLAISPSKALIDQRVDVRVQGLRPGQTFTLETTTGDVLGKRWRSRLVFRASREGVVETHSSMKLFWAMKPAQKSAVSTPFNPSVAPTRVAVRVLSHGRSLASGALVRRAQSADVIRKDLSVAAEGFVGAYFASPRGQPGPAVLQLGGSGGSYGYLPAALLASHGYRTLSLAYFKEAGLPKTLKDIPLEYFAKALRWLSTQPGVDPNRVLVYGVSRGAEAALLLGATYPELIHGVIASTPGADVNGAYPGPGDAWTLDGKPVPYGPIPIWRINGPVLAIGGGKDLISPSAFSVRQIVERAHQHERYDIVGRVYPDAGHGVGFAIPNLPTHGRVIQVGQVYLGIGGTPLANVRAWAASWPIVLNFIGSAARHQR